MHAKESMSPRSFPVQISFLSLQRLRDAGSGRGTLKEQLADTFRTRSGSKVLLAIFGRGIVGRK